MPGYSSLELSARRTFLICATLALAACIPVPERIGYPSQWVASPNFNERRPSLVVLHHTSDDTARQAIGTLTDPARKVSAHYLIARDGKIFQLVDERHRAWHAGVSRWGSIADVNSASIGIELDNNGDEPFPAEQIEALAALLTDLQSRYSIPRANFVGHADVAPGRKADPSRHFPWRTLAQRGFGLWCDPPLPSAPSDFDPVLGLQALGYEISNLSAAINAFKLHFIQDELGAELGARERDMLHCLLQTRPVKDEAD
jgi:N-acetylmuramoyl-L-alanine amidase